jgi:tetratricopeptide (TPR) repeat protein
MMITHFARWLAAVLALCFALPALATDQSKVTPADQIQFNQKNAQAQMQELQERMFRLAELTREMEPDDSAKLLMAVRKAREELIVEQMKDILELIEQQNLSDAAEEQQKVLIKLEELKKLLLATDLDLAMKIEQLKKLNEAIAKLDQAIKEQQRQEAQSKEMADAQKQNKPVDAAAFNKAQQEQQQNRQLADAVKQTAQELGSMGTAAAGSLGTASSSMSGAEGKLGEQKPGEAQPQQQEATEALKKAREELNEQRKKLLEEIEKMVRRQVIENLTDMLDRQKAVREATAALSKPVADGRREAVLRLRQLATAEQRIATIAGQTIELIETTQFSVTLPQALQNIQRRCLYVVNDLQAGRADDTVIAAEQQIERDLQDLIDTFKQLAGSSSSGGGQCQGCNGDRNQLLAALKVLRMLQLRVNEETRDADGRRADALENLPPDLRDKIGTVKQNQEQVQQATDDLHHLICPDCMK